MGARYGRYATGARPGLVFVACRARALPSDHDPGCDHRYLGVGRTANLLGIHDDPRIVIDEIAGILVTLALVPPSVPALLTGFVLFRLLDISKPPPISTIDQRLGGGFGIVADDVVAGLGANLCLQLLFRWGGAFG